MMLMPPQSYTLGTLPTINPPLFITKEELRSTQGPKHTSKCQKKTFKRVLDQLVVQFEGVIGGQF